jgi:hypothetical protein
MIFPGQRVPRFVTKPAINWQKNGYRCRSVLEWLVILAGMAVAFIPVTKLKSRM